MDYIYEVTNETILKIQQQTEKDPELQILIKQIQEGWPNKREAIDSSIIKYFNYNEELSV